MEDVRSDADDGDPRAHDGEMGLQLLVRRGVVRPPGKTSQEHPFLLSLPCRSLSPKTLAVDLQPHESRWVTCGDGLYMTRPSR